MNWSNIIWYHVVSSNFMWSHLILFDFLCHLRLFNFIWYHPIPYQIIIPDSIQFYVIESDPIKSYFIWFCLIWSNFNKSDLILFALIPCHLISTDITWSHMIQSNPILFHLINCNLLWSHQRSSSYVIWYTFISLYIL